MSDEIFTILNQEKKLKREKLRSKNRALFDKQGYVIIREFSNIINFEFEECEYFFTELNAKVRKKGCKNYISFSDFLKQGYTDFPKIKVKAISKPFIEKESNKHFFAKEVVFNWLKNAEQCEELYSKVGQFEWRKNYGIFKELKFYESSSNWYFEESKGINKDLDVTTLNNHEDVFYSDVDKGSILFVPDITIFHKGLPVYFIEIVHTSFVSEQKINRINNFFIKHGSSVEIHEIEADYILNLDKNVIPDYIESKVTYIN